jgi:hypothetical protein
MAVDKRASDSAIMLKGATPLRSAAPFAMRVELRKSRGSMFGKIQYGAARILKLERGGARFGYGVVLVSGATADANGTHYFAIELQRNAAGKDHNFAAIRSVYSKKLAARL